MTYECLQYLDLVNEGSKVLDPLLLDCLDSVQFLGGSLLGQIDNSESPRCNLAREVVLVLDFSLVRVLE